MTEPGGPRVIGAWRAAGARPHWRHHLRASLRDLFVLLREFRFTLLLFAVLMMVGTASFWLLYRHPDTGQRLSADQAMYAAFSLLFFQSSLDFPRQPWLEVLYFIVPIVGLGVLADGVLRFGVMLFNKRARKEEWQVALASTYRNHVIVCGLGKLGYRVVMQLLDFGEQVFCQYFAPDECARHRLRRAPARRAPGRRRRTRVLAHRLHARRPDQSGHCARCARA
jgi:voltage-gated potassium channel